MIDANHALDTLARKLKLPTLAFREDQVGVDVIPGLTLFLTRMDDTTLEASCLLEFLGHPDAAMMQAMLEANFLGGAVGSARLALDGDTRDVILCESWNLEELDAGTLETRFDIFANTAAFWLNAGTQSLLERAEALRAEQRQEADDLSGLVAAAGDAGESIVMRL